MCIRDSIKAAEAIAAVGPAAAPLAPELLARLAAVPDEADPRGMEQRYLCFALFNQRNGLLGRSLEGVDRDELFEAVRAGLLNDDGRARESIGSVYKQLSFEDLEPIMPEIHQAILEPAPSGIMFADGIRLQGMELLARHHVREGLPLCLELVAPDRWGMGNRIERCLNALREYGGAARSEIPRLRPCRPTWSSDDGTPNGSRSSISQAGSPRSRGRRRLSLIHI